MSYNDNNDEDLLVDFDTDEDNKKNNKDPAVDVLTFLAFPFVMGAAALYSHYEENKKANCYSCKRQFRNKEFVAIKPDSSWFEKCEMPSDFKQECENYGDKKVCVECAKKIIEDLTKRAEKLIENSKICCPRCNGRFLPNELERPGTSGLPWYWITEQYDDTEICYNCRSEIFTHEHERFYFAKEKSVDVITYPATYKGNIGIDRSSVKTNVKSGTYRNKDDALNELRLRAFIEGFNVVFDYKWNRNTETEPSNSNHIESQNYVPGTHKYSAWSVTGNFAKKVL